MAFDLETADPHWLAQIPDYPEILAAARAVARWDDHTADLLDFTYRVRLAQALMNHAPSEEMEALALHMEAVAHHPLRESVLEGLDMPYASRWRALRQVLEDRLAVRELAIPDAVKNRQHVPEILALIRDAGRIRQREIKARLDLGAANLSRILRLLETWELISRNRLGREKFITLGPRADEALGEGALAARTPEAGAVDEMGRKRPAAAGPAARTGAEGAAAGILVEGGEGTEAVWAANAGQWGRGIPGYSGLPGAQTLRTDDVLGEPA